MSSQSFEVQRRQVIFKAWIMERRGRVRIFTRKRAVPEPLSLKELYNEIQDVAKIVKETVPRPMVEKNFFAIQMLEKKPSGFGNTNLVWAWVRYTGKNYHAPFDIVSRTFDTNDKAMLELKAWHDQPRWDKVPPRPALWEPRPKLEDNSVPLLSSFRHQYVTPEPKQPREASHHYPYETHRYYGRAQTQREGVPHAKNDKKLLARRPKIG